MTKVIYDTDLSHLELIHKGKVRDIYEVDAEHILIIATDRVSAFDVILPTAIPEKGSTLCSMSSFWFEKTKHIIKNHCSDVNLRDVFETSEQYETYKNHSVVVKRMNNLPVEAIVRGYIIGSGWKDYQKTGQLCGIQLPANLQLAEKLETPIFTPSTKASVGSHDENISFEDTVHILGRDMAEQVKQVALDIYNYAYEYAYKRGVIISDTKFEFGTDNKGDLVLIDEVLTPDSSRFWDKTSYKVGQSPDSYDKQIIRNYLETLDWDKTAPGPEIPADIKNKAHERYRDIYGIITRINL